METEMEDATQPSADPVDRIESLLLSENAPVETTPEPDVEAVETAEEPEVKADAESKEEAIEQIAEAVPEEEDATETIQLEANELASILGVDESSISISDDGQLSLNAKIDGETHAATLAELLKSHQLEGHVNKRSMELADQRKAFEAEADKQTQQLAQQLQQATVLLQRGEQELMQEYNSMDWANLEITDPGQFAMQKQKFGERYQEIQQAKEQAIQGGQKISQEARVKRLQAEWQSLTDQLPAWSDVEVAKTEQADISKYLMTQSFTQEDVSNIADHRAILIARKAMLYDKQQAEKATAKSTAKKRVVNLPKVAKPGATQTKGQKAQTTYDADLKKFKKASNKHGSLSTDALADMILKHSL